MASPHNFNNYITLPLVEHEYKQNSKWNQKKKEKKLPMQALYCIVVNWIHMVNNHPITRIKTKFSKLLSRQLYHHI